MSRSFIAPQSVPDPLVAVAGTGGLIGVLVVAPIVINAWPDTTVQTVAAGVMCLSAYAATNYVDNTAENFLIVCLENQPLLRLVKENDRATMDTVLAGTFNWAVPWMLMGGRIIPIVQY